MHFFARVAQKSWRLSVWAVVAAFGLGGGVGPIAAADPSPVAKPDFKAELPRIPPQSPAAALTTFQVHPGFRIEQVAAEPLVHSPVAAAFDADNRLYVVEMIDYSEQDKERLGAVRLLEDVDGDGRFDRSAVFADNLSWPTAIACFDGGVFVGAAPDLLYLKDSDGDGRADVRQVVFTGFGRGNVQGLMNSFQWGLDNRIHGATSSSGGIVRRPNAPDDQAVNLSGRDFAIDPRRLVLRPTSGGAQHGLTFDDWGRKFVCSNSDHIQMVMFEDRYAARNLQFAPPGPRVSIAADGPQAEVFRISPVEPWRIVRTRLRVAGAATGPIEGGGRAAGYFTGATGTTIYRGSAWPAEYRGQAFVGDVGSNIIHRKLLVPHGVEFIARRADEHSEFVASSDIWFRPAQFANAPDGALYVIDVYREVIEHPASLPPEIKQHLDLTSGRDRGRIYRVVPADFRQPQLPKWSRSSTAQLVAALDHRNGWTRDTAARLLYERQDAAAVESLKSLAAHAALPEGRMHALYALHGLRQLDEAALLPRLDDESPHVKEHAIRLAEPAAAKSPALRDRLYALAASDDERVRYQLAFSLGDVGGPGKVGALAKIIRRNPHDRWIRLAVFSSLEEGADSVLASLVHDKTFCAAPEARDVLENLAELTGAQARPKAIANALGALDELPGDDNALALAIIRGLSRGVARSQSSLKDSWTVGQTRALELLARLLHDARQTSGDEHRPLAERVAAAQSLALGEFADVRDTLFQLLAARHPQELQLAALSSLTKFADPAAAAFLIATWPNLSPRLRLAATEALFSRPAWRDAVLTATEAGEFPSSDLEPARLKLLESHADPGVRARAQRLQSRLRLGRRQDVVAEYLPALNLRGDALRGKAAFQKNCATCHRLDQFGTEIGPNLAAMRNRGAEAILVNVLDPNREVNPQYVNYVATTKSGKSLTGILSAETAASVTLKRAENVTDTVLRMDIDELRSTGLSIMPEGLEKQLDQQALADLIAYLLAN